jgi:hypothetical protein
MTDLMLLGQNYCIMRVNGRTPAIKKSFDVVKKDLRQQLEQKRTEQLRSGLDKKLRATAKVEEL